MVSTEIYHMIQSGILTKWVFVTFTEMQSFFSFPFQNMLNNNHLVIKTWQLATTYLIHDNENVNY